MSTVSHPVVTMWSPKARSDGGSRMSPSTVKLTKRVIDAEPAGAARRIIWDTELRGFGVRVETSGTKTFLVRYRPKGNGRNGPKRFVTIGRYGAITPEQARNEARSKLAAVARGNDPAEARDQAKVAPTLSQLIERFLAEQATVKGRSCPVPSRNCKDSDRSRSPRR
jgi:hypothetical protein